MIDFFLFCLKALAALFAVYMIAYVFNSGWQASNYNFWKNKMKTKKQEVKVDE